MCSTKKLDEGFEKIRLAEKSLKTSFLKWRPDYEVAADEYSQAATCFKNARSLERSKDCLLKASDCHRQNNSFFHAAKCLDQAVLVCKDLNDFKAIPELAEKACYYYQQHGSPESGAASLDKAAKVLEPNHPEQALKLYQKAIDVVMIEDSPRQAAEFASKAGRIMVKLKMYDQAADAIRREIELHQQTNHIPAVGRLTVALVLVHLARGDQVAAEKAFREWGNYCEAPEMQNLEMLLQGYDEEDPDLIKRSLNHPFIKHMDVEYARLARDLLMPEENPNPRPKVSTKRENSGLFYVTPYSTVGHTRRAPLEERIGIVHDEEDDGLC